MALFAKVILAGDGAVGKTSLRKRFMESVFDGQYLMTIGADFSVKEIDVKMGSEKLQVKMQIWDLAGQPRFQEVRSVYYSGVVGAVLVYDVTRPDSFENTPKWLMEIKKNSKRGAVPVVLLANKADLRDKVDYSIPTTQGEALSKAISQYYFDTAFEEEIPYFETSAKTGKNVDDAFQTLARKIVIRHKKEKTETPI